jgi:hypothetical protein
VWRSADQPAATRPILRFRIAGDLGQDASGLKLVLKSAHGEVALVPESPPGNRWKAITVARPSGVWWIEATAENPTAWFAVTEPVEIGRLTWTAEKLIKHHMIFLLVGGLFLIAGFLFRRSNTLPSFNAAS